MFVIDRDHRIILWNRACEELTGFKAGEMIGTDRQYLPFYGD
jgi:two-component system NtrC family sensor kinase